MYVRDMPLPAAAEDDLDRLAATPGEVWPEVAAELEAHGWRVRARRVWAVEAHRDGECEEVLAETRDAAYLRLRELARLLEAPHVP